MKYVTRLIEAELESTLQAVGGVLVEGLMGSGKSELCKQRARRVVNLQLSTNDRELAEIAPEALLDGPYPTLIDEWQAAPNIWNQVRNAIDSSPEKGRFLLTGSATPAYDATRHPGVARIARLRLRPFTLVEAGHSDSSVSLAALFSGEQDKPKSTLRVNGIEQILDLIVQGGLPDVQTLSSDQARRAMQAYVQQIPLIQMPLIMSDRRSPRVMEALLRALARQLGSELRVARLCRDMAAAGVQVAESTVADYLFVLERLFLVERVPAWFTHLRSKVRLTTTDKVYFADPALAAALLGASPDDLLADLETTGFLFENLVLRELAVLVGLLDGQLMHYRDASNLEVDFVLKLPNGDWAPIEVKLGPARVGQGIAAIERLVRKLDPLHKPPRFMAVITTGGNSYLDPTSGVWVISVHHLGA